MGWVSIEEGIVPRFRTPDGWRKASEGGGNARRSAVTLRDAARDRFCKENVATKRREGGGGEEGVL